MTHERRAVPVNFIDDSLLRCLGLDMDDIDKRIWLGCPNPFSGTFGKPVEFPRFILMQRIN